MTSASHADTREEETNCWRVRGTSSAPSPGTRGKGGPGKRRVQGISEDSTKTRPSSTGDAPRLGEGRGRGRVRGRGKRKIKREERSGSENEGDEWEEKRGKKERGGGE